MNYKKKRAQPSLAFRVSVERRKTAQREECIIEIQGEMRFVFQTHNAWLDFELDRLSKAGAPLAELSESSLKRKGVGVGN